MHSTTRPVPAVLAIGLSVLGLSATSNAQVVETWNKSVDIGGAVDAEGRVIEVLSNGDLAVLGVVDFPQTGAAAIVVQRLQPDGTLVWSTTLDDPAPVSEWASELLVDAQDAVYVGGFDFVPQSAGSSNGTRRARVWKLDASGSLAWSVASAPGLDGAYQRVGVRDFELDPSGDVLVAGAVGSATSSAADAWAARITTSGAFVWQWSNPVAGENSADSIATAPGGDAYVASARGAGATSEIAVVRLTSTGSQAWEHVFGNPGPSGLPPVELIADAAGPYVAYAAGNLTLIAVAALDPSGVERWSRTLGPAGWFEAYLAFDPFGRVVVGWSRESTWRKFAATTIRTGDGGVDWDRFVQSTPSDIVESVEVDARGNVLVSGFRWYQGTSRYSGFVTSWDPAGTFRWQLERSAGPGDTSLYFLGARAVGDTLFAVGLVNSTGQTSDRELFVARFDRTAYSFCFGDGLSTPCPCGSTATKLQAGCPSSTGQGGRLYDSGASSLSGDTLVLRGIQMPNSSALYFQGTSAAGGGLGTVFGDGLRCAGGAIQRLGTKTNAFNASQFPAAGDPPVSVRGGITSPGVRTYQVWYRNSTAYCTPSTFNLTNGLTVTWTM